MMDCCRRRSKSGNFAVGEGGEPGPQRRHGAPVWRRVSHAMTDCCRQRPKSDLSVSEEQEFQPGHRGSVTNVHGSTVTALTVLPESTYPDNSTSLPAENSAGDQTLGTNQEAGTGHEAEDFTKELEDSISWEKFMDDLEAVGLTAIDLHMFLDRLQRLFSDASIVMAAEELQTPTNRLTFLRWRYDLKEFVHKVLREVGWQVMWNQAENSSKIVRNSEIDYRRLSGRFDERGLSTTRNIPRLRIAFKKLDFSAFSPESIETLCQLGCLRPQETEFSLPDAFFNKSESQLFLTRCFLLRKHPDMYSLLFKTFVEVDMSEIEDEFLVDVPHLPDTYVSRSLHEEAIEMWLFEEAAGHSNTPLFLHGMGGAGKTCLAISSTAAALRSGFHCVYWHSPGTKRLKKEDLAAMKERLDIDEKILVVFDDLEEMRLLTKLPKKVSVLVTTRDASKKEADEVKHQQIDGFCEYESQSLLRNVIGEELIEALCERNEMWKKLMQLFKDQLHLPLTINILASILYQGHDRGADFIDDLIDLLDRAKGRLETKPPRTDTISDHENVYAAIYASIDKLDEESREMFMTLCIFDETKVILPSTMSKLWKISKVEADLKLKEFADRSILINLGYQKSLKQHRFSLHKLLCDVLRADTTDDRRRNHVRESVQQYCRSPESVDFDSIDDSDVFFYGDFVGLCFSVERHDIGAACLTHLPYLIGRVRLRLSSDVLADFDTTLTACPTNESLRQYREIMDFALSSTDLSGDPDIILRLGLARRDLVHVFSDAKKLVKTEPYKGGTFLSVDTILIAPLLSYQCGSSLRDASVSISDMSREGNRWLLIGRLKNLLVANADATTDQDVNQVFDSDLIFVRFLSGGQQFVAVTETEVSVWRAPITMDSYHSSIEAVDRLALEGRCVAADMMGDALCILVQNQEDTADAPSCNVVVFDSCQLHEKKTFSCRLCSLERVVLSECGRVVCVTPRGAQEGEVEIFRLRDSWTTCLQVSGDVVGFLREGTLLCLRRDESNEGIAIRVVDIERNTVVWELESSVSGTRPEPYVFCLRETILILNRKTGTCHRHYFGSDERDDLMLRDYDRLMTAAAYGGRLIACDEKNSKLALYSLTDCLPQVKAERFSKRFTSSTMPASQMLQKPIFHWMENGKNAVMITIEQKSKLQLLVRGLHRNRVILAVDLPPDFQDEAVLSPSLTSVSKHHVAVANKSKVCQWRIENEAISSMRVASHQQILAICHSDQENKLYCLLAETANSEGDAKCKVILSKLSAGTLSKVLDVFEVGDVCSFSRMYVLDGLQRVILWSEALKRCTVLSLSGERLLAQERIDCFSVSRDCRRIFLMTSQSDSNVAGSSSVSRSGKNFPRFPCGTAIVWDVPTQFSLFLNKEDRAVSVVFSSSNTKVAFLTQDNLPEGSTQPVGKGSIGGKFRLVSTAAQQENWEVKQTVRTNDSEGRILAFNEDEESLLLSQRKGIFSVSTRDGKKTLIWEWRWARKWLDDASAAEPSSSGQSLNEDRPEIKSLVEDASVHASADPRGTIFAATDAMGNALLLNKISHSLAKSP